jgi:hypothetical protein
VRNDDDPKLPLAFAAWFRRGLAGSMQLETTDEPPAEREPPRCCRGCNSIYSLPKPSAGSKEGNDE